MRDDKLPPKNGKKERRKSRNCGGRKKICGEMRNMMIHYELVAPKPLEKF